MMWPISVATQPKTFRKTPSKQRAQLWFLSNRNFKRCIDFVWAFSFSTLFSRPIYLFIFFFGRVGVVVILSINCHGSLYTEHEIIIGSKSNPNGERGERERKKTACTEKLSKVKSTPLNYVHTNAHAKCFFFVFRG